MKLIINEQQALKTRDKETIEDITLSELVNLYLYIYKAKNKITSLFTVNRIFNNYLLKAINPSKLIKNLKSTDFDKVRKLIIDNKIANPADYISAIEHLFKITDSYFNYHVSNAYKILPIKKSFNHLEKMLQPKFIYKISDFKKIYKVCNSSFERCLILLLFFIGLRIGELRGLTWKAINKNNLNITSAVTSKVQQGCITIDPKSIFSVRSIPLPDFILKELNKLHNERPNTKYIFQTYYYKKSENPIGETTIRRILDRLAKKAHIKYLNPHSWRHSCASYLINKIDCSVLEVKEWLGHSSEEITSRIYIHLYDENKKKVAKRLNQAKKKSIK